MVPSDEMAVETTGVLPPKVLMTPPVCTSQNLTILSLLPETSSGPSGGDARGNIMFLWPERTDVLIPVIASRSTTLDSTPTATRSPVCERSRWTSEVNRPVTSVWEPHEHFNLSSDLCFVAPADPR